MKKIILNIALLICFILSIFANETSNIEEKKERPKVGLILAGGGAKGFAHLPAIKAIEELGIPIDFVAGTSIGAIVGGFYACGYSPDEIFDLVNNIEWADFFMDKPQTPMESILSENSSESNLFKIGFNNKLSLSLDSGFSSGERIYQFPAVAEIFAGEKTFLPRQGRPRGIRFRRKRVLTVKNRHLCRNTFRI